MKSRITDKLTSSLIFGLFLLFSPIPVYYFPTSYSQVNITSPQTLSNTPGNSTNPQIALYNNNLYVIWTDDSTGNGDIYFKRSVDNGTTFDTVNNISNNNTGSSSGPEIGAYSNKVYVAWADTSSNKSEIFYRQSVDAGVVFGGLKELSKTRSINGEFALSPRIITHGNNVYVAWQDKVLEGNEIFFRASNDGGNKFTGIKNLSRNNTGDSISPVLAANGNNSFVVWSDTSPGKSEILLRTSTDNGNTFGGVKNVSWNEGSSYDPQLAISNRNLYALWEDNSQGGLNFDLIFRSSSDWGRNFAEKQNIARYLGESSDYGQIIAAGDNVFVVWSESPQFSYPPKYEIFIKTSRDNGTNFGDGVNLSNNEVSSVDPHIAVSQDQKMVFVVWTDLSYESSEISLVKLQN